MSSKTRHMTSYRIRLATSYSFGKVLTSTFLPILQVNKHYSIVDLANSDMIDRSERADFEKMKDVVPWSSLGVVSWTL